jgi:hypothetical protein
MKKVLLIGPVAFLLLCALFNIVAYASIGTVGSELYALNQKTLQLEEQNKKLMRELANIRSLTLNGEKAKELGYIHVSALTQVAAKDTKVAMDQQ